MYQIKTNRLISQVPKEYVVLVCTLLAGLIGAAYEKSAGLTTSPTNHLYHLVPWLLGGLAVSFLFMGYQSILNYRKKTYDCSIALKYDDIFCEMLDERIKAAETLKKYENKLSEIKTLKKELGPIDDVLDFIDSLGFFLKGDQISDIVLHQFFYHWIRGYWVF